MISGAVVSIRRIVFQAHARVEGIWLRSGEHCRTSVVSQPLSYLLAALLIGLISEEAAGIMRLWTYKKPFYPLMNVVIAFGLVQGLGVAWTIGGKQQVGQIAPVLFMVGAVVGIAMEGANEYWLGAWSWTTKPIIGITRPIDKAAFIGVMWGFAPVVTVVIAHLLRHLWKLL
jgi:hypothetical protein